MENEEDKVEGEVAERIWASQVPQKEAPSPNKTENPQVLHFLEHSTLPYLKPDKPSQLTKGFLHCVWHNWIIASSPTQLLLLGLGFNGSSSEQKHGNCFSGFASFFVSIRTQKPQQGLEPQKRFCAAEWAPKGLLVRWIEVEGWEQEQTGVRPLRRGGCRQGGGHRCPRWEIRVPGRGGFLSVSLNFGSFMLFLNWALGFPKFVEFYVFLLFICNENGFLCFKLWVFAIVFDRKWE